MPNKQQRMQNANNYRKLMREVGPKRECDHCKELMPYGDGHFVPPSFGQPGFFMCERKP